jgi:hypothetical protein
VGEPDDFRLAGGITGTYFNGTSFERKIAVRVDEAIDFRSDGSIHPQLGINRFSVRWDGYLHFEKGGKYTLCVESDDGNRFYFNDELVIEDWIKHPTNKTCATVRVKRGWYPIKLEYFDYAYEAVIRLLRGKSRKTARVVDPVDLCCRKTPDAKQKKPRPTAFRTATSARAGLTRTTSEGR